jgi:hypothetical protein
LTPVPLEQYVEGVVPNDLSWSWAASALQAQAVASRSDAVAGQIATGWVYPDSRSQVYDPTYRTTPIDDAVDVMAGVVMTDAGSVISAYFFSECNGISTHNSENTTVWLTDSSGTSIKNRQGQYECSLAGWNYAVYCRARPCTVHAAYSLSDCGYDGHDLVLCQWGAYYRSLNGESYQSILSDYYTGIAYPTIPVTPPTATPPATPIPAPRPLGPWFVLPNQQFTLSWTSASSGVFYQVSLFPPGSGGAIRSTTTQSLNWTIVGGLSLGTYTWTIVASNGSLPVTATIWVVSHVYQSFLPRIGN